MDRSTCRSLSGCWPDFKGTLKLFRKSMAKWVYEEIDGRQWVGKEPSLVNE
jgi:hypothetical protein